MSQTKMFESLGAPLRNVRSSRGSVREADGAVFLRVWQDGTRQIDGKRYIWVSDETPGEGDPGATERLEQVKLVESGRSCYLVMCQAEDTSAERRKVKAFNAKELFQGGEVVVEDGSYWMELAGRVSAKSVAAQPHQLADSSSA